MSGASHPLVAVFADESCLGNGREGDNPGGAGALIEYQRPSSEEVIRRDVWIAESATTNNRMALRSVIDTFRVLSAKGKRLSVVFTSDSRYLIDGMQSWVRDWARRGWTRKSGPIENLELWHAAVGCRRQPRSAVAMGSRPSRSPAERVCQPPRDVCGGESSWIRWRNRLQVRSVARVTTRTWRDTHCGRPVPDLHELQGRRTVTERLERASVVTDP